MRMSQETLVQLEQDMDNEVEQRIKDYPIYVVIDGYEMDISKDRREDGEITLYLDSPLVDANGRVYKLTMEAI